MRKTFNTIGPCVESKHYLVPGLERLDLNEMIENGYYFIIHGPSKSGKTTFLQSFVNDINLNEQYYALYCSLEVLDGKISEELVIYNIVAKINESLLDSNIEKLVNIAFSDEPFFNSLAAFKVREMLKYLCLNLDKELVICFDEIDCLAGAPLITFLKQIRLGYNNRYDSTKLSFPKSIAFVGKRNIKDCLA